jgi:hypothetical protein
MGRARNNLHLLFAPKPRKGFFIEPDHDIVVFADDQQRR